MCIPAEILGESGYIPQHQKKIHTLSLRTAGKCPQPWHPGVGQREKRDICLNFWHIQSFAWYNLLAAEDFSQVSKLLSNNFERLDNLDLHLANWESADADYRNQYLNGPEFHRSDFNFLFHDVLPQNHDLSQLQSLSLGNVSFRWAAQKAVSSLSVHRLRSLKIVDCMYTDEFLAAVSDLGANLSLKTFELRDCKILTPLPALLMSFRGLRNLKLWVMLESKEASQEFWAAIAHHAGSLKSLVYHPQIYGPVRDLELGTDLKDMSRALQALCVEQLGILADPVVLQQEVSAYIRSLKPRKSDFGVDTC
jgi:hypothetical protein